MIKDLVADCVVFDNGDRLKIGLQCWKKKWWVNFCVFRKSEVDEYWYPTKNSFILQYDTMRDEVFPKLKVMIEKYDKDTENTKNFDEIKGLGDEEMKAITGQLCA